MSTLTINGTNFGSWESAFGANSNAPSAGQYYGTGGEEGSPPGETAAEALVGVAFLHPAVITGVPVVGLLCQPASGELHLFSVDADDIVAAIRVRGACRA